MTLKQAYRFWFWRDIFTMLSTLLAIGALIKYQNQAAKIAFIIYGTLLFIYQAIFPKVMFVLWFMPQYRSKVAKIPGWVYPTDSWLGMAWTLDAIEKQLEGKEANTDAIGLKTGERP